MDETFDKAVARAQLVVSQNTVYLNRRSLRFIEIRNNLNECDWNQKKSLSISTASRLMTTYLRMHLLKGLTTTFVKLQSDVLLRRHSNGDQRLPKSELASYNGHDKS
jgi:hypothetical protein